MFERQSAAGVWPPEKSLLFMFNFDSYNDNVETTLPSVVTFFSRLETSKSCRCFKINIIIMAPLHAQLKGMSPTWNDANGTLFTHQERFRTPLPSLFIDTTSGIFCMCEPTVHVCVCVSVFYHITVERRIEKLVKNKFHKRYRFFILLLFSAQCRDRNKSRATTASETACQGSATLSKSTSSPEDPHLPIGGTFRDSTPFSPCLERKKTLRTKSVKWRGCVG